MSPAPEQPSPTPEQQSAVERLYENEAIIDNLTSDVAQPVLAWAEEQILAGKDAEAVSAAVRSVNQSGVQEAPAALVAAQQALAPVAAQPSTQEQPSAPTEAKQKPTEAKQEPVEAKQEPSDVKQEPTVAVTPTVTPEPAAPPIQLEPPPTPTAPAVTTPVTTAVRTHEQPQKHSAASHKTPRTFLRRLMGWIKL